MRIEIKYKKGTSDEIFTMITEGKIVNGKIEFDFHNNTGEDVTITDVRGLKE